MGIHNSPVIIREGTYTYTDVVRFKKTNEIWAVHNLFDQQMREWRQIKNPASHTSHHSPSPTKAALMGDWVYFPWSGILIHGVREELFQEIRTNRNRNLITIDEQKKLMGSCVGFFGLSVGSFIALAAAHCGLARYMNLFEFDTLETSNLNRVFFGVHEVGIQKLELAARHIYEANPYAELRLFPGGISSSSLKKSFDIKPTMRIVIDEMDDFEIKIRLRMEARKQGIPVVMMTNVADTIIIDIERFDIDSTLPIFHGILGTVPEEILACGSKIDNEDKQRFAVALAGKENVPTRALESVKEVGMSLVGRPQLASSVTVSSGIALFFLREIILGYTVQSGRKIIKLTDI